LLIKCTDAGLYIDYHIILFLRRLALAVEMVMQMVMGSQSHSQIQIQRLSGLFLGLRISIKIPEAS